MGRPDHSRSIARHGACLASLTVLLLSACAVGPDFVRPAAPATDRYTREPQQATLAADGQAQRFTPGAAVPADWWRLFNSPQLDALVEQALAGNPTLQASEASLRRSQDNLRAGDGVFFPQAELDLAGRRERSSPAQQGLKTPGSLFNLVTLSGSVSYALDVFGGERRAVESLQAQVDNQNYLNKAAYLSLSANVVNAGIARAAYAAQLRATAQLVALETEQLQATETRYRSGIAPYSNVLSIRSLIAADQATLAPLKQKISQATHLLAILQGAEPAQAALPDIELSSLTLPTDLPLSLPSALVRQRPDILAAEAQWHAASANVGVSTAAMFPSISLNGTYGAAGPTLGNALAGGGNSLFWSVGPQLNLPLFKGGSLWFGRQAAIDAYEQARAEYRQTVLSAFAQVADSLSALEHDAEALQAQTEAQRAAGEALALVQTNYRAGLAAWLDVLVADVQYHSATIGWLQAVAQRQQDTVALFVALGGGWWNEPARPAGQQP